MKFVYGKQDWKTFERGEENCFLMTNGLGGFSSLTMIGSCGRNDHAVLMACVHSPNHRYNMIHRLEEILFIGEEEVHLSSQDYLDEAREQGFLYQTKFTYEDYPRWTYLVKGIEIVRTMVLSQGENSVGISYEIRNHSGKEAAGNRRLPWRRGRSAPTDRHSTSGQTAICGNFPSPFGRDCTMPMTTATGAGRRGALR